MCIWREHISTSSQWNWAISKLNSTRASTCTLGEGSRVQYWPLDPSLSDISPVRHSLPCFNDYVRSRRFHSLHIRHV